MAKTFGEKVKYFLGFEEGNEELLDDQYDFDDEAPDYHEDERETESHVIKTTSKNKVINVHNNAKIKIEVFQPINFEDAVDIVECLRSKKPAVVNLEGNDPERARKIFDFLNGALCALDGKAEKISRGIFLMAPRNVQIKAPKDEVVEAGHFEFTH